MMPSDRKRRGGVSGKLRLEVFQEAYATCPFCGLEQIGSLQVHHIDGDPTNDVLENLIAACGSCHEQITKGFKSEADVLKTKRMLVAHVHPFRQLSKKGGGDSVNVAQTNNSGIIANRVSYHYKESAVRPTIDLCHRGIAVTEVEPDKLYFDIPYCSGKNANAYNVKLEPAVIVRRDDGFRLLAGFGDSFPEGITLSYETGKSMSFALHPISKAFLDQMYIGVRGSYTNQSASSTYHVYDVFKLNTITGQWVRALGEEDRSARSFLQSVTQ